MSGGTATLDQIDWAAIERAKALIEPAVGSARAAMIERLDLLFARCQGGPWKTYQDGVHPVDVGGMGSGDDYAICTHGPRAFAHRDWIAEIHNEWPMVRALITELAQLPDAQSPAL